ncbi:PREDICTED: uncharacterized protein LOC105569455 [Vollenhovia emeryi]|uniref:uncharacterized protein LOC105569455 n=1 Tax=Vollenhovia emeryi TaxID=411798 RepID=UPI0005F4E477|nr:PREDICTED: uncharacterized protein LOC105569455 [Vollenhovia emeryi]
MARRAMRGHSRILHETVTEKLEAATAPTAPMAQGGEGGEKRERVRRRILTSDFEHYCGSPIFQTRPNHGAGSRGNRARENCTKLQMKKNVHGAEIPPARKKERNANGGWNITRGRVSRENRRNSFNKDRAWEAQEIDDQVFNNMCKSFDEKEHEI